MNVKRILHKVPVEQSMPVQPFSQSQNPFGWQVPCPLQFAGHDPVKEETFLKSLLTRNFPYYQSKHQVFSKMIVLTMEDKYHYSKDMHK